MTLISHRQPSAAMIVAVLTLSLALGGSAVAGSGVLTKQQVKTVANKQITKRAPRLAVASATRAAPRQAVVATVRPDGMPVTTAT
jgi:hypothetical protein